MSQNKPFVETFRSAVLCCTYDDEVWSLVDMALSIGDQETKELASKIKGMDVDEAQAYLQPHP
ncbi:MAG: hypothetical protein J6A29_05805 [Clostridia bacterium]|nr:hypothetical protein [Clostridia bacterium]